MTEYVEESFKYERDVSMETWTPLTTTQVMRRSIQNYLTSLEDNKLSETSILIQHAIVLRKMHEALEEAIVNPVIPSVLKTNEIPGGGGSGSPPYEKQ